MQNAAVPIKCESKEFGIAGGAVVSSSTSSSSSPASHRPGNMCPPPPPPPPKIKIVDIKLEEPTSSIPDLGIPNVRGSRMPTGKINVACTWPSNFAGQRHVVLRILTPIFPGE
ncbi:unnamed protein product [Phyllotreta striolata]|uniref:Uncharacterized protein n=1 Tax=Phyllotreta striolata TaxID=444603 RepID=A0A9N9U0I1_PHYSR|nr:unnamed protein product [Phyllotreta striolata]